MAAFDQSLQSMKSRVGDQCIASVFYGQKKKKQKTTKDTHSKWHCHWWSKVRPCWRSQNIVNRVHRVLGVRPLSRSFVVLIICRPPPQFIVILVGYLHYTLPLSELCENSRARMLSKASFIWLSGNVKILNFHGCGESPQYVRIVRKRCGWVDLSPSCV